MKVDPEKFAALKTRAMSLNIELKLAGEGVLALYHAGRLPFSKQFKTLGEVSVWLDAVGVNNA